MNVSIIIPAYNEEKTIAEVVRRAKKHSSKVIVIDDASSDNTSKIATMEGAKVYKHSINRGLGGSLGTGFKVALIENTEILITLDADCQHDPEDIPAIIRPITDGQADVVIGSRFLSRQNMPALRRLYNNLSNIITFSLFGVKTTDSQSGFRAFNKRAIESIKIKSNRMEVSSEIIKEIGLRNLRMKEIPIKAIYTEYSLSKGQGFIVGIKTFLKLLILKIIN